MYRKALIQGSPLSGHAATLRRHPGGCQHKAAACRQVSPQRVLSYVQKGHKGHQGSILTPPIRGKVAEFCNRAHATLVVKKMT